mmetsp:Transcript_679/g.1589  ORF Transcript_679/g.1589 Transcript_679/m.1589 type:complete len:214 (-) Transcript_679:398-1039(-)
MKTASTRALWTRFSWRSMKRSWFAKVAGLPSLPTATSTRAHMQLTNDTAWASSFFAAGISTWASGPRTTCTALGSTTTVAAQLIRANSSWAIDTAGVVWSGATTRSTMASSTGAYARATVSLSSARAAGPGRGSTEASSRTVCAMVRAATSLPTRKPRAPMWASGWKIDLKARARPTFPMALSTRAPSLMVARTGMGFTAGPRAVKIARTKAR